MASNTPQLFFAPAPTSPPPSASPPSDPLVDSPPAGPRRNRFALYRPPWADARARSPRARLAWTAGIFLALLATAVGVLLL